MSEIPSIQEAFDDVRKQGEEAGKIFFPNETEKNQNQDEIVDNPKELLQKMESLLGNFDKELLEAENIFNQKKTELPEDIKG